MFLSFLERHSSADLCLKYGEMDACQQALEDPFEIRLITGVAPKRAAEFTAGRNLARQTMQALGFPAQAIHQDPKSRAPLWPANLVGSISHHANHVIAAVGNAKAIQSVGLDIENIERIKEKTFSYILGVREQAWIQAFTEEEKRLYAGCIFSAKESFYKWQYPLTQSWLGFKDAEVRLSLSDSTFEIHLLKSVSGLKAGFKIQGHSAFHAPFWVTLIYSKA